MELEYQDPKRRAKIIVALGLVLAIVAGGGAFLLITNAQEQAGQASLTRVAIVVAKVQIPARKALSLDDVEVREVPVDGTNAEGVFSNPAAVVGLIPSVTILAGQPIYANMLASQVQGGQFSILEPGETVGPDSPAWRAVSLTVPDDRAVGGQLQPGDIVDVFTTILVTIPDDLATEGRYFTDRSTKITYQNLVVLARSTTFYVLRVPAASAEEINHLQATGSGAFSFALRPAADARLVDASRLGATTNLILQRYGLPIPEVWPPGNGPIPTPLPTPTPAPSPAAASSSPAP
jgi:Flp pilus assembly protein CpaB